MPPEIEAMKAFPSVFDNPWQVSRVLHCLAGWSGGRSATVWIPQFASLRNHVREISRTAAGSRVERLSRTLSLWPDVTEVSATLPAGPASDLLAAALEEAPALLELGYPAGEGLDFVTRIPGPNQNTRRTPAQMRAAVHHLGGDFDTLLTLMKVPDPFAPCLRATVSVWPRFMAPRDLEALSLAAPGLRTGSCISWRTTLRGYCLLVMFDLAARLKASDAIRCPFQSFGEFVDEIS